MRTTAHDQAPEGTLEGGRLPWRVGDILFYGLTAAAAAATLGLVVWLSVKVVAQAWGAIEEFGLSFIWTVAWDPVTQEFGALDFIYGTVVTSFIALLIATPMSIAIALFLTELAPRWIRGPVGTLVELLAAIPSVILGLWGILVFGPWVAAHLEPWLQKWFGFLPIFSGQPSQAGLLPAALVLTIMIIPITSSICRELFSRVPRDLTDGALALGATRWETIRGVTIPYAGPGIVAAVLLGLGRAFGEAIAVTQVIGAGSASRSHGSSRPTRWPAGSRRNTRAPCPGCRSTRSSYLAAILLVISLITNVAAQAVVRRFERSRRDHVSTYDVTVRSAGLRRRRIVQSIFAVLATLSALAAVAMLGACDRLGRRRQGRLVAQRSTSSPSRAGSSARRAGSRTRSSAA